MNSNFYSETNSKRVKERSIQDAYQKVQQWRYFFRNGFKENGILKKVTLKEAADLVNVPKKTLEDYIQIFNKAELIINIEEISEKKMGYLRTFMKKNKSKIRKAMILHKQKQKEETVQKQKQKGYECVQESKIEDEQLTFTISQNLSENSEYEKDSFQQDDDWEYSVLFFNKFSKNP